MRPETRTGGGPSQRMLRVGELVRHALAEVLQRGNITDPVLSAHIITVPEVRMSPDLKIATCFVMPLGGKDVAPVIKALAANARFLRAELARRVELKSVPDLRFREDTSFEEGARMDALLRSPIVARDVSADVHGAPDHDPDDTPAHDDDTARDPRAPADDMHQTAHQTAQEKKSK